jgi:hypothetical protein
MKSGTPVPAVTLQPSPIRFDRLNGNTPVREISGSSLVMAVLDRSERAIGGRTPAEVALGGAA